MDAGTQVSQAAILPTSMVHVDATTGNLILTLTNVPSGTAAMDQIGDLLNTATTQTQALSFAGTQLKLSI